MLIIMDINAPSQVVSTKYPITVRCLVHKHVVTQVELRMTVAGFRAFTLLSDARRVIMGIVVNHELEMTEIR